jgi:hypothetical protein
MADSHKSTSMVILYDINFLCRRINILETPYQVINITW